MKSNNNNKSIESINERYFRSACLRDSNYKANIRIKIKLRQVAGEKLRITFGAWGKMSNQIGLARRLAPATFWLTKSANSLLCSPSPSSDLRAWGKQKIRPQQVSGRLLGEGER